MNELAGYFATSSRLVLLATALGLMGLEYFLGRLAHHDTHDPFESAASLGIAAGQSVVRAIEATLLAIPLPSSISTGCSTSRRPRRWRLPGCSWRRSSPIIGSIAPHTGSTGCGQPMRCIIRQPS